MFENNFSGNQTGSREGSNLNRPAPEASSALAGGGISFTAVLIFTVTLAAGLSLAAAGSTRLLNSNLPAANNVVLPAPVTVITASSDIPNPSTLAIPSLNLAAPFEPLGLNPNHTIEVPKNNMGVGWFIYGAKPGEVGAAVIVASVTFLAPA